MSTVLELLPQMIGEEERDASSEAACRKTRVAIEGGCCAYPGVVEGQISGLVRQLFLQRQRKKPRQVLFSSVGEEGEIGSLCMMVGRALNLQDSGTTCVVEALPCDTATEVRAIDDPVSRQAKFGLLRDAAQQVSDRLWFMRRELLREDGALHWSASWIRGRLAELRLDFDYTVLEGPAIGSHDEAMQLARLCDGIVLVVRANKTRRIVAQEIR
ncbi:MAG: hypothetical protein JOZ80_02855, partial [Acidobacteriaceae bacterium]|nr:hypothetical protein [Acidobacteriaceae bacterium]